MKRAMMCCDSCTTLLEFLVHTSNIMIVCKWFFFFFFYPCLFPWCKTWTVSAIVEECGGRFHCSPPYYRSQWKLWIGGWRGKLETKKKQTQKLWFRNLWSSRVCSSLHPQLFRPMMLCRTIPKCRADPSHDALWQICVCVSEEGDSMYGSGFYVMWNFVFEMICFYVDLALFEMGHESFSQFFMLVKMLISHS